MAPTNENNVPTTCSTYLQTFTEVTEDNKGPHR